MTAKLAIVGGPGRTIVEFRCSCLNWIGREWTIAVAMPAVFKTVCGALNYNPRAVRRVYPMTVACIA